MFAIVLIDHRLALAALAALLVVAAAPLAYAWARLLPDEPPPFEAPADRAADAVKAKPDPFAIFLLACVTLSYVLRFPGLPLSAALHWLATLLPADYFNWTVLAARAFFVVVPGLAAAYSAFRPSPFRAALAVAGVLVLLLWLVSPFLRASIAST